MSFSIRHNRGEAMVSCNSMRQHTSRCRAAAKFLDGNGNGGLGLRQSQRERPYVSRTRHLSSLLALGSDLARCASKRADAGAEFPDPGDQDHQRLARGRRRRPVGADYRRPAPEAVGPPGHGGKPDRRQQQHRGRGGRESGTRWLYPARHAAQHPHRQCSPVQAAQLRSGRARAGGDHGGRPQRSGSEGRFARQDRCRPDRSRQGQPGKTQLRLAG